MRTKRLTFPQTMGKLLPDGLSWDMGLFFSLWSPTETSVLLLELVPLAVLVLGSSSDWNYTSTLLGLQLSRCRSQPL